MNGKSKLVVDPYISDRKFRPDTIGLKLSRQKLGVSAACARSTYRHSTCYSLKCTCPCHGMVRGGKAGV